MSSQWPRVFLSYFDENRQIFSLRRKIWTNLIGSIPDSFSESFWKWRPFQKSELLLSSKKMTVTVYEYLDFYYRKIRPHVDRRTFPGSRNQEWLDQADKLFIRSVKVPVGSWSIGNSAQVGVNINRVCKRKPQKKQKPLKHRKWTPHGTKDIKSVRRNYWSWRPKMTKFLMEFWQENQKSAISNHWCAQPRNKKSRDIQPRFVLFESTQ